MHRTETTTTQQLCPAQNRIQGRSQFVRKSCQKLIFDILVYLLQSHRQVSIELLTSVMPYPIQIESRKRSLQRFLKLDCLNIDSLWFLLFLLTSGKGQKI